MLEPKPIPGYSRYGITEDGRLFNLQSGEELRTSKNARGYHVTILVNDNGERKGVKRHRLLALAHLDLPEGDLDDFVVNHKDLIPGNDTKDNLEWCTQKHNVEHWVKLDGKRRSTALETLDVADDTVTRYNSIAECSNALGLERYSIQLRLDRGPQYVWPEGFRYRIGHSDSPWPPIEKLEYGRSREVLLKSLRTGKVFLFNKLTDTLHLTGYKLAAMWKWASDPAQPVIPGLYQIQFVDGCKPWREVEDVFLDLQDGMRNKVVFRFDEDWSNPIWYESARVCAEINGLKTTALNYRLKSRGQVVYSDGKRYCYYEDLSTDQKKTIRYEIPPEGRVQRPSNATVAADATQ